MKAWVAKCSVRATLMNSCRSGYRNHPGSLKDVQGIGQARRKSIAYSCEAKTPPRSSFSQQKLSSAGSKAASSGLLHPSRTHPCAGTFAHKPSNPSGRQAGSGRATESLVTASLWIRSVSASQGRSLVDGEISGWRVYALCLFNTN